MKSKLNSAFYCCIKSRRNKPGQDYLSALPDDLLIHLLRDPTLDFKTFYAVARTSRRMRAMVHQVLQCYILPSIQLATVIDQDGRGRWTTCFRFLSLDELTLTATFVPVTNAYKRYRCDGTTGPPMLRRIVLLSQPGILLASRKDDRNKKKELCHLNDEENDDNEYKKGNTTLTRQSQRLGIRRCGIRKLQPSSSSSSCFGFNPTWPPNNTWHLSYFVDAHHRTAKAIQRVATTTSILNPDELVFPFSEPDAAVRHVVPLYLCVHFSFLCQQHSRKHWIFSSRRS